MKRGLFFGLFTYNTEYMSYCKGNLNQNKCLNSNRASNMTAKVAKPIKNGHKQGRLCMIEFHFFGMPIKTLGSLGKIRVGRVTGNTHIFFFGLTLPYLPI